MGKTMSAKIVARKIREESSQNLSKTLVTLKSELTSLKIAKATRNGNVKLQRIGEVRKSIARVLTVINQGRVSDARKAFVGKNLPKSLRVKKTRAIRQALTKRQQALVTPREQKRAQNIGTRKYALTA
eukprot:GDKJ01024136.1.p2 GENE.GDKJ01024136.1~~GDKJ01024136.1.p2  ORF type:complete len:128 (-),score=29.48 GDKJ01024136.1:70-453(-)